MEAAIQRNPPESLCHSPNLVIGIAANLSGIPTAAGSALPPSQARAIHQMYHSINLLFTTMSPSSSAHLHCAAECIPAVLVCVTS